MNRVLIVGGGTAGWMTAAALAHKLAGTGIAITLVESEAIGTVGVGEATVPHIRHFNAALGIDEADFMARTGATFKLGNNFRNWGRIGDDYIHPFGAYGEPAGDVGFHHLWRRAGANAPPIEACSLPIQAARLGRFAPPSRDPHALGSTFSYAYQFDAGRYAAYLRAYAEARGVVRTEGRIETVERGERDGFVAAVMLEGGRRIAADLFVDCSGFRALLIGGTLGAAWESWSQWLPCDRAIAIPTPNRERIAPYTQATALSAGWAWHIPLQHRAGNGHVYASAFLGDGEAEAELRRILPGDPIAEPIRLRFGAGRRSRQWIGNTVAIGLSAGFLEPLESTSIHLIQVAIGRLLDLFPTDAWDPLDAAEFDRLMAREYDHIRDFLVLHYHATERDDTPFWRHVGSMALPPSLEEKMALWRARGTVTRYGDGMFLEPSWIAVYLGQRVMPAGWDPRADALPRAALDRLLAETARRCRAAAEAMPPHEAALG